MGLEDSIRDIIHKAAHRQAMVLSSLVLIHQALIHQALIHQVIR